MSAWSAPVCAAARLFHGCALVSLLLNFSLPNVFVAPRFSSLALRSPDCGSSCLVPRRPARKTRSRPRLLISELLFYHFLYFRLLLFSPFSLVDFARDHKFYRIIFVTDQCERDIILYNLRLDCCPRRSIRVVAHQNSVTEVVSRSLIFDNWNVFLSVSPSTGSIRRTPILILS